MRNRRLLLVSISLLLAIHALAVSRSLPSSFFLLAFFGWTWVGTAALFDRLEAVKSMAVSMVALSLIAALVTMATHLGQGDMTAFYSIALFPSVIAWVCVYVYTLHIQRAEDVGGRVMNAWFEEKKAERNARLEASGAIGSLFAQEITNGVSQDNDEARRASMRAAS